MICLLDIIQDTVVDGVGIRTTIYSAGCPHHCSGCHNPQSWHIENGSGISIENIMQEIRKNPIANITFSGGEPFFQAEGFLSLAKRIKAETHKTIWCYTGYRYEELLKVPLYKELLSYIDVLVDGRFEECKKEDSLRFRGSSNQRIIDIKKALHEEQERLEERNTKSFRNVFY